ncbi:hypothetical protein [Thalassotalea profundi]|uniref:Sugar transporter n=1 Tax=Thalassotalea profundi TaxID=2036687 RepID=A0ABQ3IIQ2_9GAMM|nr:hypothetical protein [Thalassotalea profundi]GHE84856.1 hypothetical protein GCM10011501_12150 [Thalassotalea profundi]
MNNSSVIPKWYKIIAIIAVIWNILGLLAFVGHIMMTPDMLATLPLAEQELYKNMPLWATLAFATAVLTGLLGSIGLLLKKAFCLPLLITSLIAVIIQDIHSFLVIDTISVYGAQAIIMPIFVIIIAIFLIFLAKKAKNNHWFE